MKYIVDRIEDEYAVCKAGNQSMVNIPLIQLQPGIKEGDSINVEEEAASFFPPDGDGKRRIKALMDDLKDI